MKILLLAAALAAASTGAAFAQPSSTGSGQAYPSKPVRVIVGFPAGGGVDITARIFSAKLSEIWGSPILVETAPALADLMGGHVSAMLGNLPEQIGAIKAGKVRAVGISSVMPLPASAEPRNHRRIGRAGLRGHGVVRRGRSRRRSEAGPGEDPRRHDQGAQDAGPAAAPAGSGRRPRTDDARAVRGFHQVRNRQVGESGESRGHDAAVAAKSRKAKGKRQKAEGGRREAEGGRTLPNVIYFSLFPFPFRLESPSITHHLSRSGTLHASSVTPTSRLKASSAMLRWMRLPM